MNYVKHLDTAATAIMGAGAIGSQFGLSTINHSGKQKKATQAYYALVGLASAYKAIRALGYKTESEKRVEKAAKLYDTAEAYRHKVKSNVHSAEMMLRKRIKNIKALSSK